jgi:DHA2 family multidrug resistance protein-like MFS transporter
MLWRNRDAIEGGLTMTVTAAPQRAGRKEWIGLAVIALPCLLYSMDLTVLNVAVPELSASLEPSSTQLLWIIDIYGFMVAGFLITMGTLGDRIGRRRLLMFGALAFGAGSVLAAFSTSAEMLIAARALLGVAGATLAPSTLSLIFSMFHDPQQRTVAIGVWIASYSAGAIVGPVFGGLLLELFWWGSVFLLAVPVMALLLVLAPVLLPESRNPDAGRIDLPSVALSLAAVLAAIYGLKQIAQDGVELLSALSIVAGALLAVVFVDRQRRLIEPLIDLELFGRPAFSTALAAYGLGFGVMFGGYVLVLQHLQLVLGYSPLGAGALMAAAGTGFVLGGILAPPLAQRLRPGVVMAAGLGVAALAFSAFTQVEATTPTALIVVAFGVLAFGVTPVFTLATDMVVGSAPRERAGVASGISETGAEFGGALGIAVFGSIGLAVYRGNLADGALADLPAGELEAARDTLAGATEAAAQLPNAASTVLLATAHDAFAAGLQVAAVTGTVVLAALAVIAAVLLRDVEPASPPEPEVGPAAATVPVS